MAIEREYQIESTLPKPWEEERTFNDSLSDWMASGPWLAISIILHVSGYFVVSAIPWHLLNPDDEKVMMAQNVQQEEDPLDEEEEEPEEELEEPEPIEEPVLKDAEVSDHNEDESDDVYEEAEGDPDFASDSPFDSDAFNDVLGIGGGAGGKMGGRRGGRRNLRAGRGVDQALRDGLEWLKNHQSPDGYWDCDDYMNNHVHEGVCECDGAGHAPHDVGVTGLALLAFLGEGNTTSEGDYKDVVAKGIGWLREIQDPDTGLFGEMSSHEFLYNHALASLAVCEAYYASKSPLLKRTAQRAIYYIQRARNPYGAWRYDVPPIGDQDTSVSAWMVCALRSAEAAGLEIDKAAYDGAMNWLDEVTDTGTGRVGYDDTGSRSARVSGVNDHFPPEKGEAMTSAALLCRFLLGQDPKEAPIMTKHADLMLKTLPEWDPEGLGCDMYYWYWGTYAMLHTGGESWGVWKKSVLEAARSSLAGAGDDKGSWEPTGPWGSFGGRVYSTALMALCLEAELRLIWPR